MDTKGKVLIVIDIQEKLLPAICNKEEVVKNAVKVIGFCRTVGIPIVITEQYPKGLGKTIPEIAAALGEFKPIEKVHFSCFGQPEFDEKLKELDCRKLIVIGIETHVCVYQTVMKALKHYDVSVISDAVGSRENSNKQIGLDRTREAGAEISSAEMFMFEVLEKAGSEEFKKCMPFLK